MSNQGISPLHFVPEHYPFRLLLPLYLIFHHPDKCPTPPYHRLLRTRSTNRPSLGLDGIAGTTEFTTMIAYDTYLVVGFARKGEEPGRTNHKPATGTEGLTKPRAKETPSKLILLRFCGNNIDSKASNRGSAPRFPRVPCFVNRSFTAVGGDSPQAVSIRSTSHGSGARTPLRFENLPNQVNSPRISHKIATIICC
ncbi:hypothetical protein F4805DRAFT_114306 [Annulohypoxylon moriforme]|nr:hypothetical protein F4805DRAFT_114306 [Annulohypoxylon moriforme]